MPYSSAENRGLKYPLTYSLTNASQSPNEPIPIYQLTWPTEDNDERVDIVMNMSLNEFVAIATALDVGRDIAFGDDSHLIWWLWQRSLKTVDICAAVAECIYTSSLVQDALRAYLNESGQNDGKGNITEPLPPSIMAGNIIPLSALCTEANKYAMARAIVQQVDSLATDFLEVIELITSHKEIAAELVENVPIFGGIASTALDVAAWIDDYVKTSYQAAYNSTTEVDYSCVIYCAFDGCELTWDSVIAAYEDQASITPPSSDDFIEVIQWMYTNVIPSGDNLIVGSMHLFVLNALKWGSSFMGSGVWTALEIAVEDASDEEITVPAECSCAPLPPCWEFSDPFGSDLGILTGAGDVQSVYEPAFSVESNRYRVQVAMPDFEIGVSSNTFTFTSLVAGSFTGLVRIWQGGSFDGTLVFSGTLANAISASPIAGGSLDMRNGADYTVELDWTTKPDEC